ncbi:hypothetical protein [Actinomycetospora atypica]|uniref:Uncharacterized protein n=1 Tax=Actinomycetospora atypica TaxID=1290095 RepID=A0ABV9YMH8_9PSEU
MAAAAAALLVALTVAQTAAGARFTTALGLTPPPQSFTEIFVDSTAPLPGMLPLGASATVPVSFTLGNGSPDAASYRWSITQQAGSAPPAVLATGTTDVAAGVRRARTVPVTVTCSAPEIVVAIAVAGVDQPVTRHVTCQVPRR